jgi:hypothetical protein
MEKTQKIRLAITGYVIIYTVGLIIVLTAEHNVFWGRVLGAFAVATAVNVCCIGAVLFFSFKHYVAEPRNKRSFSNAVKRTIRKLF